MAKLFDEYGNPVEDHQAFTAEEVAALQKEAVDKYVAENPNKTAELAEAEKKVADLTKKLEEGGGMPDGQKRRLLDEKKVAEEALKEVTDKFMKEVTTLKENLFGSVKSRALNTLSRGNKESAEKIEAKYQSLMKTGEYPDSEEGIQRAMTDAATLVMGSRPAPGFLDNATNTGGMRGDGAGKDNAVESDNSIAMRKAFGISDEDAKKFTPKQ
jgi:hypothetical protein